MNKQQAINLLKNLEQSLDDYCELNDEGKTAFRMAITALNCSEFPNSSDTISRQQAIDTFLTELTKREWKNLLHTWLTVEVKYFVVDMLEKLPSAQPERKKGRWYDVGSLSCRCSACGCKSQRESMFCPNCGARMEGGDENGET